MLEEPQQATGRINGEKPKMSCFALEWRLSPTGRQVGPNQNLRSSVLILSQADCRDTWGHEVISSTLFSPSNNTLTTPVNINLSPLKPVITQGRTLSQQ